MLTVYVYETCSTCRAALAWLRHHHINHRTVPIKDHPPSRAELERMAAAYGGELRRIFNTSGLEYRRLSLASRLDAMPPAEAYALLGGNGMLVKRPFVLGPGVALAGFDAKVWTRNLPAMGAGSFSPAP